MSNGLELVAYDQSTRQLSTVPDAFKARDLNVLSIVWESGINPGAAVNSGTKLATVQWADNSREPIIAPATCAGQISSVNRNIAFENLPLEPSQWLLILSSG